MNGSNANTKQRFTRVLKDDLRNVSFKRDVKREFKELRSFYITEEQNERLDGMRRLRKAFHLIIWMIKSLFLHLTPIRRLLTTIGLIVIILGSGIIINDGSVQVNNTGLVGGTLIFIVLMLELKDKLLAKDELEAGRKVQQALMPEHNPEIDGWTVWIYTRPANEVGGDLVDYLKINEERIGLTIADVAGKGLQAALLTAKLQATVRALAGNYESLSELCTKINSIFYRDSLANIFASMIYMEIIPGNPGIRFVNGGHLPPLLLKQNEIKEITAGNPALGLMNNYSYKEDSLNMESGDILVAYSDGVTEARDEFGRFYEKDNFIKLLTKIRNYDLDKMGETIVNTINFFISDAPVNDDLSLILIKRN